VIRRVVIDHTSEEWREARRRSLVLLAAQKGDLNLPELRRVLNEIEQAPNAMNGVANLVAALTFIGALSTEFLARSARREFTEVLAELDSLVEAAVRKLEGRGIDVRAHRNAPPQFGAPSYTPDAWGGVYESTKPGQVDTCGSSPPCAYRSESQANRGSG
jgi:hypothetical protein